MRSSVRPHDTASPADTNRTGARQSVSNLVNVRDLGALPTTDGHSTQAGVLYRSDAPYPSDQLPSSLPVWPPEVVIDLRSHGEYTGAHPWADHSKVVQMPILRDAAVVTDVEPPTTQNTKRLEKIYNDILSAHPERLAQVVTLAARGAGPVHIHCAAGKDRTGVTVAILLLAAGVRTESIISDYTATGQNMDALITRLEALGRRKADAPRPAVSMLAAPAHLIEMVIDRVSGTRGVDHWLAQHGCPRDATEIWRRRFVDGYAG